MKKILALLLLLSLFPAISYAAVDIEAKPLVFQPDTGGKYIYCNNNEFIRRSDLADVSNEFSRYIMNNTLAPDKYSMFVSHVNHTEVRDKNNAIVETGFDVELDVVFCAIEDTKILLTSLGFEVPEHSKYYYNGEPYKYEEAWGCMNAWADYLGIPIKELDSGVTYTSHKITPVEINIKKGEKVWLSKFIKNYKPVPFYRPVLLLADFEVISGKTEANVAAVKSTGTIGDRSRVHPNPAFGTYVKEKQYKGIADSLNKMDTELSYTIADWVGGKLPVKVFNSYVPDGKVITNWFTNINPFADPWNKENAVASDMLSFKYVDNSKLRYYGKDVPESERDNVWIFDINHTDFSSYPGSVSDKSYNRFKPNDVITTKTHQSGAGNFGNYGVRLNYKITVTNEGKITRYLKYYLKTVSNNIVILKDENGNPVDSYAICKGESDEKTTDCMACITLPGETTRTYIIEVILPTNYVGGMENFLQIENTKSITAVYDSALEKIPRDLSFTGKEYVKWINEDIHTSTDGVNWIAKNVSTDTKNIFRGNWNQYEIMYMKDKGYAVKPTLYDSQPYYGIREFFTKMYFLDENFNLSSSHTFYQYPTEMSFANGVLYVTAGSMYESENLSDFNITDGSFLHPVDNGHLFSVRKRGKKIQYSTGKEFTDGIFEGDSPDFVEKAGDIYYFTRSNNLYLSYDGMYFEKMTLSGPLESITKVGDTLKVNEKTVESQFSKNYYVSYNGQYLVFENKPFIKNSKMYVPYKFLKKVCPENVKMSDALLTIANGEVFVPVAQDCRQNGYNISYDERTNCAVIEDFSKE